MRDQTFVTHVLDLLEPALGPLQARAMMGGHLVFCGGLSVALLSDERLYLKTDGQTEDTFGKAGCEPFVYEHSGRKVTMSYWCPPDAALEDPEEMRPWAKLALEAAMRAKKPAKKPAKKKKEPVKVKIARKAPKTVRTRKSAKAATSRR
ncbi:MAG TPA: TfoX/Sxy family protein [Myxococcales bacterium]|jgi:DNA transformation protein